MPSNLFWMQFKDGCYCKGLIQFTNSLLWFKWIDLAWVYSSWKKIVPLKFTKWRAAILTYCYNWLKKMWCGSGGDHCKKWEFADKEIIVFATFEWQSRLTEFYRQIDNTRLKVKYDLQLNYTIVPLRLSQAGEKTFRFNFVFKQSHYNVILTGTSL